MRAQAHAAFPTSNPTPAAQVKLTCHTPRGFVCQVSSLQHQVRADSASFPKGKPYLLWKTSSGPAARGDGEAERRPPLPPPPSRLPSIDTSPLFVPSCMSFSIYTPWGERCEHLSMKLGAFFGILFGALGALLLLGAIVFVVHRFWCTKTRFSYPLDSES